MHFKLNYSRIKNPFVVFFCTMIVFISLNRMTAIWRNNWIINKYILSLFLLLFFNGIFQRSFLVNQQHEDCLINTEIKRFEEGIWIFLIICICFPYVNHLELSNILLVWHYQYDKNIALKLYHFQISHTVSYVNN